MRISATSGLARSITSMAVAACTSTTRTAICWS
jgi:hypothetical protein